MEQRSKCEVPRANIIKYLGLQKFTYPLHEVWYPYRFAQPSLAREAKPTVLKGFQLRVRKHLLDVAKYASSPLRERLYGALFTQPLNVLSKGLRRDQVRSRNPLWPAVHKGAETSFRIWE